MKRNILNIFIVLAGMLGLFSACSKSFLEISPRGSFLESNYYQNQDQVYQGLIAIYDVLQWQGSNGYSPYLGLLNTASDDCEAGGSGPGDQPTWVAYDNFTLTATLGPQQGLWQTNFTGVSRANILLSKIEGAQGLTPAFKARVIGEAKFLRGYFYFNLVRFFGRVPLILHPLATSELYSQKQVEPADIYKQIEKDLTDAANTAEIPQASTLAATEKGRITKGTVWAVLGSAILFQNNNGRMQEAADWFEKVNNPAAGYHLESSYAQIFDPNNRFGPESVFEIPHAANSAWGDWGFLNGSEGNIVVQMIGMRDYQGPTFAVGWGFNPITTSLANFLKSDPRYTATVIDAVALKATGVTYTNNFQETGYYIRKFAPIASLKATQGVPELNWVGNELRIRLADTYLLEAEALVRAGNAGTKAKDYLDAVRGRVGLGSIPATLDNIYDERRRELATEGQRFWDLVRTGKAAAVLGAKGFAAGKHEVLPIPQNEIDITNRVLVQNNY
jgi:hypothetical protein